MSRILYLDDRADDLMSGLSAEQKQQITAYDPNSKENDADIATSIQESDLWLLDYFLVEQHDARVGNGLSNFQKYRPAVSGNVPTTILTSSDLENAVDKDLQSFLSFELRHIAARLTGVNWLAKKPQPNADGSFSENREITAIFEISDAVQEIKEAISTQIENQQAGEESEANRRSFEARLLGLPEGDWMESAERSIARLRPPAMARDTDNLNASARDVIAWLVEKILPYPTFLISDLYAAVELGIAKETFELLADSPSGILAHAEYVGPLKTLQERRWWKPVIDQIVWQASSKTGEYACYLEDALGQKDIPLLDQTQPVVAHDESLVSGGSIEEVTDCVRAIDDHFPAGVEPVWVLKSAARQNRRLREKVVFDDQELLDD